MTRPEHILITGASSGIGAALAASYARPGVTLSLGGRDRARLDQIAQTCRDQGAAVDTEAVDVTDRPAMAAWIEQADDAQPLDLVIANAGISGGGGGSETGEPFAQVRAIFDVNVTGVINTAEPTLPRMIARRSGQVALMSSLAAFSGWPGAPAYSAAKGAVRLYGEALRGKMKSCNVKINVICPGFIRTPMTDVNDYSMPFLMGPDRAAAIIKRKLARNAGRIAFPWQTYLLAGFFGLLPFGLTERCLSGLPEKPQNNA